MTPELQKLEVVPTQFRNHGYSFGLGYLYIFGKLPDGWAVWHRRTGKVVYRPDLNPALDGCLFELDACKEALRLNGNPRPVIE
jgi:hypothetical protein